MLQFSVYRKKNRFRFQTVYKLSEYETITFCLQIPCEKKTMCEIKAELELPLRQMTSHETQYCVHTQQMNMAVALDTVDQIKR